MSIVRITESILGDIADAIREKKNTSDTFTPTEMADEISSIETGVSPITVNITQSEHQTITATATATSSQLPVVNGQVSAPTAITVNASITADSGYVPGTLNQTSVVANWGDTVSFSASPAIQYVPFSITVNVNPSSYTSEAASTIDSIYLQYYIAGIQFTLIPGQTVTEYVPPNTNYNTSLWDITVRPSYAKYSWYPTSLQGNTGNGVSTTLTLTRVDIPIPVTLQLDWQNVPTEDKVDLDIDLYDETTREVYADTVSFTSANNYTVSMNLTRTHNYSFDVNSALQDNNLDHLDYSNNNFTVSDNLTHTVFLYSSIITIEDEPTPL